MFPWVSVREQNCAPAAGWRGAVAPRLALLSQPPAVQHRPRPALERAEQRFAADGPLQRETAEQDRARVGYTDENGDYRKIIAGLRARQVRVTAPDGRKWTEDAKPSVPAQ